MLQAQAPETPSNATPPSTYKPATRSAIHAAAVAIAETLGARPYTIVGGAACMLLGLMRLTEDVDLVVPKGAIAEYRTLFRTPEAEARGFSTGAEQPRHTFHGAEGVLIEFLSPAGMFRGQFDGGTPTVVVDRVRVLQPLRLLDTKCESVFSRGGEQKKHTDAEDIKFSLATARIMGLSSRRAACPMRTLMLLSTSFPRAGCRERLG